MHLRRATGEVKRRHARERAARIQLRNRFSLRMPTSLASRKAVSREPLCEGLVEPPESLARGTLSEGFPANVGDLRVSADARYRVVKGDQRLPGRAWRGLRSL